jgi:NCS1 family nucleobase:cation symporter-1
VTSAGIALYGQVIWDPLKLIDHWDNRAAAFFTSFAFTLGTLGTNVSANSLSAGNDMTALWPRYINIRRGQVICAILGGWALCPWEILARCVRLKRNLLGYRSATVVSFPAVLYSATGFLAFMGGYTVFLGPIAGIMVTDVSTTLFLSSLSRSSETDGGFVA